MDILDLQHEDGLDASKWDGIKQELFASLPTSVLQKISDDCANEVQDRDAIRRGPEAAIKRMKDKQRSKCA